MLAGDDHAKIVRSVLDALHAVDQARVDKDYARAIYILAWLFKSAGMGETYRWLGALYFAVEDLKHGRLDPLLTPKNAGNRPPDPTVVWWTRAYVAAAATLLAKSRGMTRAKAVATIASECPDLKYIASPKADLEKSISTWRDEFEKRRVKNRFAAACYAEALKGKRGDHVADLLSAAEAQARAIKT
jgi:hypothetical protein